MWKTASRRAETARQKSRSAFKISAHDSLLAAMSKNPRHFCIYAATRATSCRMRVQQRVQERSRDLRLRSLEATCGAMLKKMKCVSVQRDWRPPPRWPAWIDARSCKKAATQRQRGCEGSGVLSQPERGSDEACCPQKDELRCGALPS